MLHSYGSMSLVDDISDGGHTAVIPGGNLHAFLLRGGVHHFSSADVDRHMAAIVNDIARLLVGRADSVAGTALGIGISGISTLPGVKLAPVASLKVKVLQIKTLKQEDGTIGYGRYGHITPEGTRIATIPVGYADGIDRHLGRGNASFNLGGHRVPTIGNICMDMCMLDVSGVPAEAGDTVTIFGEDPTVTELASILGTIPYEIMTSVPRRIERIIVGR